MGMIRLTPNMAQLLIKAIKNLAGLNKYELSSDVGKVVDRVEEQLRNPGYSGELIDILAEVLKTNQGRTKLDGSLYQTLQAAVLSPAEVAKLKALVNNPRYQCSYCGRKMHLGELVTLQSGGPVCYRCATPSLVTCHNCNHAVPISDVSRNINKAYKGCQRCAAIRDGRPVEEADGPGEGRTAAPAAPQEAQTQDRPVFVGGRRSQRGIVEEQLRVQRIRPATMNPFRMQEEEISANRMSTEWISVGGRFGDAVTSGGTFVGSTATPSTSTNRPTLISDDALAGGDLGGDRDEER